jgi:hydroxymethylpyrimidine/phosphomethylpyrimidine kinase
MKHVLTIAGSDSCGGAGIQADLKTFSAHGTYGMSVITAVTAQNTTGVFDVHNIPSSVVGSQLDAVFSDISIAAVKIGMVSISDTIEVIAQKLLEYKPCNIVLDPVMISKSGCNLLQPSAMKALSTMLLPLASIITPNLPEAEALTNMVIADIEAMKKAAILLHNMGPKYVLIKGGHLKDASTDILYDGNNFHFFEAKRIMTKNTHGTGCTLSSAIAANLALGLDIAMAVETSKKYITTAIEHSLDIGQGVGPTNHFYDLYRRAGLSYGE